MKRVLVIALALVTLLTCVIPLVVTQAAEPAPPNEPPPTVDVRGLDELEEMRGMLAKSDEELEAYLDTIRGLGLNSREDLINFLTLVDSTPVLKLIDGEISWIRYYPVTNQLSITTEAENGDWVRLEYFLSLTPAEGLEKRENNGYFENSTLTEPIKSQDERVTVYAQSKKPHASGTGEIVYWIMVIDDIFAKAVYYDKSASGIEAEDVFANVQIINIPDFSNKFALGDLNGNGEIDSMDYVLLKRAYFGTYSLADEAVGDINRNGKIDSMDYVFLKRAYFGTYEIE